VPSLFCFRVLSWAVELQYSGLVNALGVQVDGTAGVGADLNWS
jgi:hypothetical protein